VKKPGRISGRRTITIASLGIFLLLLLLLTLLLEWSEATRKVDRLLHDTWVKANQRDVPADIVIAALDTYSLDDLGRWPWPRDQQAALFEKLAEAGVKAAIVDVLYTESAPQAEWDKQLGEAIAKIPVSVLPFLGEGGGRDKLFEGLPVPSILRHVSELGHIMLPIDDDGIVRRVHLKAGLNHAHWPSLGLAALKTLGEMPDPIPGRRDTQPAAGNEWLVDYEVLIPFYGSTGVFPRISAAKIIRGEVPREQLAGKIVFVGLTTTGLGDVVPSPVSALNFPVPGVEIHANIFAGLREGVMVTRADESISYVLAISILPLLLLVYSRALPEWSLVSASLGACVPIGISYLLYTQAQLWYPPLPSSVPIFLSYLIWSRHRLKYINRFLELEQRKSAKHLPSRISNTNESLVKFFETATDHLPIAAWRFTIRKEQFSGGKPLPNIPAASFEPRWVLRKGVYTRRYPRSGDLRLEVLLENLDKGTEITRYIDSLARVRSREQSSRLTGSIERLQTNAQGLREQMDKLRNIKVFSDTLLAGSPAGFAVWNAAGECIRANDLINQQIVDFRRRGRLIEFVASLGLDLDSQEISDRLNSLILEKNSWQLTYRQAERELVVNFRALGDSLVDRLICASIVDVSDIRTAERARAEMVDYLSHDLRSPLISALYLLEDNNDPRIEQNIQHSLDMMDNLLHVARADNLSEARFEPVLLNAVLDNSINQLLPQAMSVNTRFDFDSDDDDFWVIGDAASLERAISNIIGNAIKYSPEATIITIRLVRDDDRAVLTVDDQGVGISPDMLDALFTRFKRDTQRAGDIQGIGLGLALVSRVVGLHHGEVYAENLPKGARITLKLPLESDIDIEEGLMSETCSGTSSETSATA